MKIRMYYEDHYWHFENQHNDGACMAFINDGNVVVFLPDQFGDSSFWVNNFTETAPCHVFYYPNIEMAASEWGSKSWRKRGLADRSIINIESIPFMLDSQGYMVLSYKGQNYLGFPGFGWRCLSKWYKTVEGIIKGEEQS